MSCAGRLWGMRVALRVTANAFCTIDGQACPGKASAHLADLVFDVVALQRLPEDGVDIPHVTNGLSGGQVRLHAPARVKSDAVSNGQQCDRLDR